MYLLENTYPRERITPQVKKAGDLVQSFLEPCLLVEFGDHGSVCHRNRLFWTNMQPIEVLEKVMPKMLLPSPPLHEVLLPFYEPCFLGHSDQRPFAPHNVRGEDRICMPTVASFLHSNAYRPKEDGSPGEGQIFNVIYSRWEEIAVGEKEMMLGYREGDTAAAEVTEAQRAIRLGRALDNHCAILVLSWRPPRNRGRDPLSRTPLTHRLGGGLPYIPPTHIYTTTLLHKRCSWLQILSFQPSCRHNGHQPGTWWLHSKLRRGREQRTLFARVPCHL